MSYSRGRSEVPKFVKVVIPIVVLLFVFLIVAAVGDLFYVQRIEAHEIGLPFRSGKLLTPVGPGYYVKFGWLVEMRVISQQAIPFRVEDLEVITKDTQRIGVIATGDIFRPGVDNIRDYWQKYRIYFVNDDAVLAKVQAFTQQAFKSCVGENTFTNNVIGEARDALGTCIGVALSKHVEPLGLTVRNVVVPEVLISDPAVIARMDEIVQERLSTEKAGQEALRATAQAKADAAKEAGAVMVSQAKLQEEARQQTVLAELEGQRLAAQRQIIEAERDNELARIEANRDNALALLDANRLTIEAENANRIATAQYALQIAKIDADASEEDARGAVAGQAAIAELYEMDEYLQYSLAYANASALNPTDKLIFTNGVMPTLIFTEGTGSPTIVEVP